MSLTHAQTARPQIRIQPGEPRRCAEVRCPVYTLTHVETQERHEVENPEQLTAVLQALILKHPGARFDLLVTPSAIVPCGTPGSE